MATRIDTDATNANLKLSTAELRERLAWLNREPSTPSNRVRRAAIVRVLFSRQQQESDENV